MLSVAITSFSYTARPILENVSFSLARGQHLSVLGESGCGKSTLLHLIYGLLHLEHGELYWSDKELKGPKHNLVPGEPFMKLVAQEFNIMPYITVTENVATHLSRMDSQSDAARVTQLLEVVGLSTMGEVMAKELSGGQKQRVALAKALAKEPKLLLLDEPFSHIDTFRKNTLRRKLFAYLKEKKISCITATHDSEEALAFSDQVLILNNGTIETMGTPTDVYANLQTPYQASFFGEVTVLPASLFETESTPETLLLLPYQLAVSKNATSLQVTVTASYFKGSHYLIESFWKGQKVFFVSSEKLENAEMAFLKRI